jgi:Zn-dependent peptidase ImmA (M78 family)
LKIQQIFATFANLVCKGSLFHNRFNTIKVMPYYSPSSKAKDIGNFAETLRAALARIHPELGESPYLTPDKATKVVNTLGGELIYVEEWDVQNGIGLIEPIHGAETKPQFRIIVPKHNQFPQRNMFTVAHEIGHLFLHLRYNTPEWKKAKTMFRDTTASIITEEFQSAEWEANEFAACYLMPEREFEVLYAKCGDDIQCVAKKLFVSQAAVRVRLQSLRRKNRIA